MKRALVTTVLAFVAMTALLAVNVQAAKNLGFRRALP
jgi:hypothetical protein